MKDIGAKFNNMQEVSIRTRDALKTRQNELTDQLQKLEVKHTEMEYRVAAAAKQLELNSQVLNASQSQAVVPM